METPVFFLCRHIDRDFVMHDAILVEHHIVRFRGLFSMFRRRRENRLKLEERVFFTVISNVTVVGCPGCHPSVCERNTFSYCMPQIHTI